MKNFRTLLLLLFIAVAGWQCSQLSKGVTIEGELANAGNLQVFLDKVVIGKANSVLSKTEINSSGNFSFSFPEGLESGVYNLRIGAKRINLILDGSEKKIRISGDLNTLQDYAVQISGSSDSEAFANMMKGLADGKYKAADVKNFIDTTQNPTMGAFLAFRTLGPNPSFMDLHRAAQAKLAAADPSSEMASEYGKFISAFQTQYQAMMADELIRVGQPAPDIRLQGPNGKEFALSDLKGKVVLLDFWASWCGPCRRENPNVVEVYKRYKDKGFTVFSVSLDGVDETTRARFNEVDQVSQMIADSRQRWIAAIEQDGLIWESHVSDLKKWDSAPASIYGVRGIPKTFLIDREGKIAEIGLRGAAAIEQALLKYL